MRYLSILSICFFSISSYSQGSVVVPLRTNPALNGKSAVHIGKRSLGDTLDLPFFDDFTTTKVYPDTRFWMDNQVYVNDHFPVSPPSFGVATFDNLDYRGRPYQPISGNSHNHSDSLTSNCINLKSYLNLGNPVDYTIADSIYLSFFYQTQGLGDPLDNTDSLVLKFKNGNGFWKTVWKTTGTAVKPFKQVLVGVKDTQYLKKNFQFRFINYCKTTGNLNQWHLDYVRMNSSRNYQDTIIEDIAFNSVPEGPLMWYESMPYSHFKANPAANLTDSVRIWVRNNYIDSSNLQFQYDVRNIYNQQIHFEPFTSINGNVQAGSEFRQGFSKLKLDTFTGKEPIVRLKFNLNDASSHDGLEGKYESKGNNNEYIKTVQFKNYFAHDDGSAEGGYGLDYGSLPAGPAYAAIKFTTYKPDTLRGLSIFFNRSNSDVQFKSFTLMVWKQISEPPAPNTSGDVILKTVEVPTAIYTDSINGFTNFVFDTAVALDQGQFYVGWRQNTNFILNIGYDNNYKYAKSGGRNPNLFFNMNGYWEKVSANITGAVMIRPIVGDPLPKDPNASMKNVTAGAFNSVKVYPNPGGNSDKIFFESKDRIISFNIYSSNGFKLDSLQGEALENYQTANLPQGMYLLEFTNEYGNKSYQKWIK